MDLPHGFSWRVGRAAALGGRPNLLAEPERIELLPLRMLKAEAAAAALQAHRRPPKERALRWLECAMLNREIARRTGDVAVLTKAASAAAKAIDPAATPRLRVRARLEECAASLLAAELFGDDAAAETAEVRLAALADDSRRLAPEERLHLALLVARTKGRRALASADLNLAVESAADFDAAVAAAARYRHDEAGALQLAAARSERAEFTLGFGQRLKDAGLIQQALGDMTALAAELDPARAPLSWTRVEQLHAAALLALGELEGSADRLGAAAALLSAVSDHVGAEHAPLDAARTEHALGLALQALGEACDDANLFDTALAAFDRASEGLEQSGELSFRAVCAFDRVACIARRAERSRDLRALDYAEAAFKLELKSMKPARDPLAWAVVQVALARVYEARASLVGDHGECADAAVALAAALEVFNERGFASLAGATLSGLERLKTTAV